MFFVIQALEQTNAEKHSVDGEASGFVMHHVDNMPAIFMIITLLSGTINNTGRLGSSPILIIVNGYY